jgi:hypothetical protein
MFSPEQVDLRAGLLAQVCAAGCVAGASLSRPTLPNRFAISQNFVELLFAMDTTNLQQINKYAYKILTV